MDRPQNPPHGRIVLAAILASLAVSLVAGMPFPAAWAHSSEGDGATSDAAASADAGSGNPGDHSFIVLPTRVVFEGHTRSAAVTLVNKGTVGAVYRIGFVRMRMSETGLIRPITAPESGESFADTLVRYSPRQVELGPQESQTIRLQLRKPADLPAGEFRSHLLVQEVPRAVAEEEALPAASDPAGVRVHITSIFGIAIPIIVREGPTTAAVRFSDLRVSPSRTPGQPSQAIVEMRRDGNRSVYGDLTLVHVPDHGRRKIVGVVKGISVYTPNRLRVIQIPVTLPRNRGPAHGHLLARFSDTTPGAPAIAEASFLLP
jgi:hypothetical protein